MKMLTCSKVIHRNLIDSMQHYYSFYRCFNTICGKTQERKKMIRKSFFYDTDGKYDTLSLVVYQKNL